jgi:hypothetical protein
MRNVNRAQVNNVVANVVVVDRQDRQVVVGMITVRERLPMIPRLHRPRFLKAVNRLVGRAVTKRVTRPG